MKLHLPSGLRKALLACITAIAAHSVPVTVATGVAYASSGALVSFLLSQQAAADEEDIPGGGTDEEELSLLTLEEIAALSAVEESAGSVVYSAEYGIAPIASNGAEFTGPTDIEWGTAIGYADVTNRTLQEGRIYNVRRWNGGTAPLQGGAGGELKYAIASGDNLILSADNYTLSVNNLWLTSEVANPTNGNKFKIGHAGYLTSAIQNIYIDKAGLWFDMGQGAQVTGLTANFYLGAATGTGLASSNTVLQIGNHAGVTTSGFLYIVQDTAIGLQGNAAKFIVSELKGSGDLTISSAGNSANTADNSGLILTGGGAEYAGRISFTGNNDVVQRIYLGGNLNVTGFGGDRGVNISKWGEVASVQVTITGSDAANSARRMTFGSGVSLVLAANASQTFTNSTLRDISITLGDSSVLALSGANTVFTGSTISGAGTLSILDGTHSLSNVTLGSDLKLEVNLTNGAKLNMEGFNMGDFHITLSLSDLALGSDLGESYTLFENWNSAYADRFTLETVMIGRKQLSFANGVISISGAPEDITWSTGDITWADESSANQNSGWTNASGADKFYNGDNVTFTHTTGGTITLGENISTNNMTIAAGAWTVSGNSHTLSVLGTLTLQNNASLTLNNSAASAYTLNNVTIGEGAELRVIVTDTNYNPFASVSTITGAGSLVLEAQTTNELIWKTLIDTLFSGTGNRLHELKLVRGESLSSPVPMWNFSSATLAGIEHLVIGDGMVFAFDSTTLNYTANRLTDGNGQTIANVLHLNGDGNGGARGALHSTNNSRVDWDVTLDSDATISVNTVTMTIEGAMRFAGKTLTIGHQATSLTDGMVVLKNIAEAGNIRVRLGSLALNFSGLSGEESHLAAHELTIDADKKLRLMQTSGVAYGVDILKGAGTVEAVTALADNGGATVGGQATIALSNELTAYNETVDFTGTIGAGVTVKMSGGYWNFGGTLNGALNLSSGNLRLTGVTLGSGSSVTTSGGTLDLSGTVTLNGGSMSLTGATVTGTLTMESGSLTLGAGSSLGELVVNGGSITVTGNTSLTSLTVNTELGMSFVYGSCLDLASASFENGALVITITGWDNAAAGSIYQLFGNNFSADWLQYITVLVDGLSTELSVVLNADGSLRIESRNSFELNQGDASNGEAEWGLNSWNGNEDYQNNGEERVVFNSEGAEITLVGDDEVVRASSMKVNGASYTFSSEEGSEHSLEVHDLQLDVDSAEPGASLTFNVDMTVTGSVEGGGDITVANGSTFTLSNAVENSNLRFILKDEASTLSLGGASTVGGITVLDGSNANVTLGGNLTLSALSVQSGGHLTFSKGGIATFAAGDADDDTAWVEFGDSISSANLADLTFNTGTGFKKAGNGTTTLVVDGVSSTDMAIWVTGGTLHLDGDNKQQLTVNGSVTVSGGILKIDSQGGATCWYTFNSDLNIADGAAMNISSDRVLLRQGGTLNGTLTMNYSSQLILETDLIVGATGRINVSGGAQIVTAEGVDSAYVVYSTAPAGLATDGTYSGNTRYSGTAFCNLLGGSASSVGLSFKGVTLYISNNGGTLGRLLRIDEGAKLLFAGAGSTTINGALSGAGTLEVATEISNTQENRWLTLSQGGSIGTLGFNAWGGGLALGGDLTVGALAAGSDPNNATSADDKRRYVIKSVEGAEASLILDISANATAKKVEFLDGLTLVKRGTANQTLENSILSCSVTVEAGTLTLSGANTNANSASFLLNGGSLTLGENVSLVGSTITLNGGTLDGLRQGTNLGNLIVSSNIKIGPGVIINGYVQVDAGVSLTFGNPGAQDWTVKGALRGEGSLYVYDKALTLESGGSIGMLTSAWSSSIKLGDNLTVKGVGTSPNNGHESDSTFSVLADHTASLIFDTSDADIDIHDFNWSYDGIGLGVTGGNTLTMNSGTFTTISVEGGSTLAFSTTLTADSLTATAGSTLSVGRDGHLSGLTSLTVNGDGKLNIVFSGFSADDFMGDGYELFQGGTFDDNWWNLINLDFGFQGSELYDIVYNGGRITLTEKNFDFLYWGSNADGTWDAAGTDWSNTEGGEAGQAFDSEKKVVFGAAEGNPQIALGDDIESAGVVVKGNYTFNMEGHTLTIGEGGLTLAAGSALGLMGSDTVVNGSVWLEGNAALTLGSEGRLTTNWLALGDHTLTVWGNGTLSAAAGELLLSSGTLMLTQTVHVGSDVTLESGATLITQKNGNTAAVVEGRVTIQDGATLKVDAGNLTIGSFEANGGSTTTGLCIFGDGGTERTLTVTGESRLNGNLHIAWGGALSLGADLIVGSGATFSTGEGEQGVMSSIKGEAGVYILFDGLSGVVVGSALESWLTARSNAKFGTFSSIDAELGYGFTGGGTINLKTADNNSTDGSVTLTRAFKVDTGTTVVIFDGNWDMQSFAGDGTIVIQSAKTDSTSQKVTLHHGGSIGTLGFNTWGGWLDIEGSLLTINALSANNDLDGATGRVRKISGDGGTLTIDIAGEATAKHVTFDTGLTVIKQGEGTQNLKDTTLNGTLEVTAGTIAFTEGTDGSGNLTVSGGSVSFAGGAELGGAVAVSGTGSVSFTDDATLGSVNATGGSISFAGSTTITGDVMVDGGTVDFTGATNVSGTVTVRSNTLTWEHRGGNHHDFFGWQDAIDSFVHFGTLDIQTQINGTFEILRNLSVGTLTWGDDVTTIYIHDKEDDAAGNRMRPFMSVDNRLDAAGSTATLKVMSAVLLLKEGGIIGGDLSTGWGGGLILGADLEVCGNFSKDTNAVTFRSYDEQDHYLALRNATETAREQAIGQLQNVSFINVGIKKTGAGELKLTGEGTLNTFVNVAEGTLTLGGATTVNGAFTLGATLKLESGVTLSVQSLALEGDSATLALSSLTNTAVITGGTDATLSGSLTLDLSAWSGLEAALTGTEVTFGLFGDFSSYDLTLAIKDWTNSSLAQKGWSYEFANGNLVFTREASDFLYWVSEDGTWSTAEGDYDWAIDEGGDAEYAFNAEKKLVFDSNEQEAEVTLASDISAAGIIVEGSYAFNLGTHTLTVGDSGLTVEDGAALKLTNGTVSTGSLSGEGGITIGEGGALTLTGSTDYAGTITLSRGIGSNAASITFGADGITLGAALTLTEHAVIAAGGHSFVLGADGVTHDLGNKVLIFDNAGTQGVMKGDLTNVGGIKFFGGTAAAELHITGSLTSSGTVQVHRHSNPNVTHNLYLDGTVSGVSEFNTNGANLHLTGSLEMTSGLTFSGSGESNLESGVVVTGSENITLTGSTLTIAAGADLSGYEGTLIVNGGTAKVLSNLTNVNLGSGTLELSADVTGTLALQDGASAWGGVPGTHGIADRLKVKTNVNVGALTSTKMAKVNFDAGDTQVTLTVGSLTIAASETGDNKANHLNVHGNGILALSGQNNTVAGQLYISGNAIVQLADGAQLSVGALGEFTDCGGSILPDAETGSATVKLLGLTNEAGAMQEKTGSNYTIGAGITLELADGVLQTLKTSTVNGNVQLDGANARLTYTGEGNSMSGNLTGDGGTMQVGNGTTAGTLSFSGSVTGNAALALNNGTLNLAKSGDSDTATHTLGTVSLTGTTNSIAVQSGNWSLAGLNGTGALSSVSVAAGSTLSVNTIAATLASLELNGTLKMGRGAGNQLTLNSLTLGGDATLAVTDLSEYAGPDTDNAIIHFDSLTAPLSGSLALDLNTWDGLNDLLSGTDDISFALFSGSINGLGITGLDGWSKIEVMGVWKVSYEDGNLVFRYEESTTPNILRWASNADGEWSADETTDWATEEGAEGEYAFENGKSVVFGVSGASKEAVTVSGAITVRDMTVEDDYTFTGAAGASITVEGALTVASGKTMTLGVDMTANRMTVHNLTLNGGVLTVNNSLTVNGVVTLSLSSTGSAQIKPGEGFSFGENALTFDLQESLEGLATELESGLALFDFSDWSGAADWDWAEMSSLFTFNNTGLELESNQHLEIDENGMLTLVTSAQSGDELFWSDTTGGVWSAGTQWGDSDGADGSSGYESGKKVVFGEEPTRTNVTLQGNIEVDEMEVRDNYSFTTNGEDNDLTVHQSLHIVYDKSATFLGSGTVAINSVTGEGTLVVDVNGGDGVTVSLGEDAKESFEGNVTLNSGRLTLTEGLILNGSEDQEKMADTGILTLTKGELEIAGGDISAKVIVIGEKPALRTFSVVALSETADDSTTVIVDGDNRKAKLTAGSIIGAGTLANADNGYENTLEGDLSGFTGAISAGNGSSWTLTGKLSRTELDANLTGAGKVSIAYTGSDALTLHGAITGSVSIENAMGAGKTLVLANGINASTGSLIFNDNVIQLGTAASAGAWAGTELAGKGEFVLVNGTLEQAVTETGDVTITVDAQGKVDAGGAASSKISAITIQGDKGGKLTNVEGDIVAGGKSGISVNLVLGRQNIGDSAKSGESLISGSNLAINEIGKGGLTLDFSNEAFLQILENHRQDDYKTWLHLTDSKLTAADDLNSLLSSGYGALLGEIGFNFVGTDSGALVIAGTSKNVYLALNEWKGEEDAKSRSHEVVGNDILSAFVATVVDSGVTLDVTADPGELTVNNLVGLSGSTFAAHRAAGATGEVSIVLNNAKVSEVDQPGIDHLDDKNAEIGLDTTFEGLVTGDRDVNFVKTGQGTLTVGNGKGEGGLQLEGNLTLADGGLTLQGDDASKVNDLIFAYTEDADDKGLEVTKGATLTVNSLVEAEAQGGDIRLTEKGSLVLNGESELHATSISADSRSALSVNGSLSLEDGASVKGGSLSISKDGVVAVGAGSSITPDAVELEGTLDLGTSVGNSTGTLSGEGLLSGDGGSLSITGKGSVYAGSLSGSGTLAVASGADLTLDGVTAKNTDWTANVAKDASLTVDLRKSPSSVSLDIVLNEGSAFNYIFNADDSTRLSGNLLVKGDAELTLTIESLTEGFDPSSEIDLGLTLSEGSLDNLKKGFTLGGAVGRVLDAELALDANNGLCITNVKKRDENVFDQGFTSKNAKAGATLLWGATDNVWTNPEGDLYAFWLSALMTPDMRSLERPLAAFAGASTAVLGAAVTQDLERQLNTIRNRTTMLSDSQVNADPGQPEYHMWINAESAYHKLDADGLAPGFTLNGWGGTVGTDVQFANNVNAGIALTAMYNDLKTDSADNGRGDIDTTYLSVFARVADGAWTHTFVATAGKVDVNLNRTVGMPLGGSYRTHGETDGYTLGAMYEVGYTFMMNEEGTFAVQPIANVQFKHTSLSSYDERNSNAGLHVDGISNDVVTLGAGARIQKIIGENAFNRASILEARALVKVDMGDRSGSATTSLLAGSPKAEVESARVGRVGIELGAGVSVPIDSQSGAIFVDGSVELRSGYSSMNASAGYRMSF